MKKESGEDRGFCIPAGGRMVRRVTTPYSESLDSKFLTPAVMGRRVVEAHRDVEVSANIVAIRASRMHL